MTRPRLTDAQARATIGRDLDSTLAVEAAAGTGKTTVLVDRIVNVLASGRTTVDRIVAVTFTEKAAGELKLRLRTVLESRRATAAAETRKHLEAALASLEQAHVSTIHTFCADLLRERPVEAGVDPQFVMLTEPQAVRLFGEVFRDWLERQLEAPPEGVRRALRRGGSLDEERGPIGRLEKAAWTLAEWRDFDGTWRRPAFDQRARVDAAIAQLQAFAALTADAADRQDPLSVSTLPARRLASEVALGERVRPRDYDRLEARLVELCTWKFRHVNTGRRSAPYRKGVPRAQVLDAHGALLATLDAFKRDADADLAALLKGELAEVLEVYRAAKERLGALDFLDLLVCARALVRDRADVRLAFQARFTHLFVDEFQDTDPLQAEILLLLAAADPACRDWKAVAPAPGKLFVVGDPKQSIYRFRRADVGIYQAVREQLVRHGALPITLDNSFRSVPAIQRVVNAAFSSLMTGDREAVQADYVALRPVRADPGDQPGVVVLPVPRPLGAREQVTKTAIVKSLPDAVGAFVHWLVTESGWRVVDRDSQARVPIEARHVCLLFRRFDTRVFENGVGAMQDVTRPYVQALEARGLPHLLVGGKSFHDREEVETMRTALAAIEWPDDELSVFGTLRGPLFAIGDDVLLDYRARAGRLHPFRRTEAAGEADVAPVVEVLTLLRDLHQRRNHRPVAETVTRLLDASRAHAIFALWPSGEQALANVQYIGELARQYEAGGGISFRGFVDQLQEEAEATRASEAPILEEGSDGVRLMTAHKAKGLEFPIVILADITAELSRGTASRWVDADGGRCAVSLAGWAPADLLDHQDVEVKRDAAEGVRVAYVAATRARDLLVIPAVGDGPFDPGWVAPLNRALYPPADRRRDPRREAWAEHFRADSMIDRERTIPFANVRPGIHRFAEGEPAGEPYDVSWWDPGALDLGRQPTYGLRREELIAKDAPPGLVEDALERHHAWKTRRERAVERGQRPSRRVMTVRARAAQLETTPAAAEVVAIPRPERSPVAGPRFGALVHAVLALVPLDADETMVAAIAGQQARLLAATDPEAREAAALVVRALAHPLFERIRRAERAGRVRREVPVALADADGLVMEGIVDLAFSEDGRWTVVDFKTDLDPADALETYRRQVQLYADAIAQATGLPCTGLLLRL